MKEEKTWRFVGSRRGLLNFPRLLREYAANPRNSRVSEHQHFGPYWYLTVVTSDEAVITARDIQGSLAHLASLADLIEKKVSATNVGERVSLGPDYSPQSEFTLRFEVMAEDFDTASADSLLFG